MSTPNAVNIMYETFRNNKLQGDRSIKTGQSNLNTIKNSLKQVKGKCTAANCLSSERTKNAEISKKI